MDTDTDADRIAAAVLSCPAVAALHGGRFGEIATYLPGRRISGVRHDAGPTGVHVDVHVVGRYPVPVAEVAAQVRAAVAAAVPGPPVPAGLVPAGPVVDVTVEDYLDPAAEVLVAAIVVDSLVADPLVADHLVADTLVADPPVTGPPVADVRVVDPLAPGAT